jgi:hypothetical protein
MSLINDALRQASQAHKEQAGLPPQPANPTGPPPLPPVLQAAPLSPWPALLKVLGVVVLVIVLGGAGVLVLRKVWVSHRVEVVAKTNPPSQPVPQAQATTTRPVKAVTPPVTPPAVKQVLPAVSSASNTVVVTAPQPTPTPPVAAVKATTPREPALAPTNVAQVKWPALRLQGLFFHPPNSSVVINNKTLFVDDDIQGVKVAQIDRMGVILLMNGQTNVLHLR